MYRFRLSLLAALFAAPLLLSGCASTVAGTNDLSSYAPGDEIERGIASWYGPGYAGNRTASGEVFDPDAITAAHKTLPFGTRITVVHLGNGREVTVRINDRGPFVRGRVIDLSRAAAERIGMIDEGLAEVRLILAK
ncbi:MAG: septal ring lytic transglycosylase RlpA family protein [Bacteroidota bacterium]